MESESVACTETRGLQLQDTPRDLRVVPKLVPAFEGLPMDARLANLTLVADRGRHDGTMHPTDALSVATEQTGNYCSDWHSMKPEHDESRGLFGSGPRYDHEPDDEHTLDLQPAMEDDESRGLFGKGPRYDHEPEDEHILQSSIF